MTFKTKLLISAILSFGLIMSADAFAGKKNKKSRPKPKKAAVSRCGPNVAQSSMYFVPHIKDYCGSLEPCPAFKDEVRMQGSGVLSGNQVYQYLPTPGTKKKYVTRDIGSCDTAIGAAGECLIPFVSIAADPKFYSMGDVISMPAMKGKEILLPNGKKMIHPGYFIVHDTGGAIKGSNRFDFFTGSYDDHNPNNAFGYDGFAEMAMTDKKNCSKNKSFTVVRRGKGKYDSIIAAIDSAKLGQSDPQVIASHDTVAEGADGGARRNYVRGVQ